MKLLGALAFAVALAPLTALAAEEEFVCPDAPNPVVSLAYSSRYKDSDARRATIDPRKEAEAEAAIAPVDAFILQLSRTIDDMYEAPIKQRPVLAACVVDQLGIWAASDALSDLETVTAALTIGSRYAALSLILWQTLPYAYEHRGRKTVANWLEKRTNEQTAFWDNAPSGSRSGNLRAWAGLSAAAIAIQTKNKDLLDWAKVSASDVMCSANPDGSLPQEMSRGRLALHYQLHAIAPLTATAALLEREGIPMQNLCDSALTRIVNFAIEDLDDGKKTRKITGIKQSYFDGTDNVEPFQLAWIEAYLSFADDKKLSEMSRQLAPLSYSKLGGNQTALWGK